MTHDIIDCSYGSDNCSNVRRKSKMQDNCLDVLNKPFYKRRKQLIPPTSGASFSTSKIMLMLTWRCNYINYGTIPVLTVGKFSKWCTLAQHNYAYHFHRFCLLMACWSWLLQSRPFFWFTAVIITSTFALHFAVWLLRIVGVARLIRMAKDRPMNFDLFSQVASVTRGGTTSACQRKCFTRTFFRGQSSIYWNVCVDDTRMSYLLCSVTLPQILSARQEVCYN